MMEYLKWQIIIIIYLFTSVFIIFFEKYDYDVLENNSLQSFGKGRIGFLSDKILYNVVKVGENETLESALRRFKRKCARAGVLSEVRKREHYEKPSVKKKKKSEAARKRKFK